jgi:hypothetical protein
MLSFVLLELPVPPFFTKKTLEMTSRKRKAEVESRTYEHGRLVGAPPLKETVEADVKTLAEEAEAKPLRVEYTSFRGGTSIVRVHSNKEVLESPYLKEIAACEREGNETIRIKTSLADEDLQEAVVLVNKMDLLQWNCPFHLVPLIELASQLQLPFLEDVIKKWAVQYSSSKYTGGKTHDGRTLDRYGALAEMLHKSAITGLDIIAPILANRPATAKSVWSPSDMDKSVLQTSFDSQWAHETDPEIMHTIAAEVDLPDLGLRQMIHTSLTAKQEDSLQELFLSKGIWKPRETTRWVIHGGAAFAILQHA